MCQPVRGVCWEAGCGCAGCLAACRERAARERCSFAFARAWRAGEEEGSSLTVVAARTGEGNALSTLI